jgi:hypothetical protein
MFIATAFVSAGFALATIVLRAWPFTAIVPPLAKALVASFGPFGVLALMGAGVGELFGRPKDGAKAGATLGVVLSVLWILGSFGMAAIRGHW